jgi:hypothetical protein
VHSAPPVAVECGGGLGWRGVQSALYALSAALPVAWMASWSGAPQVGVAAAAMAAAMAGGLIAWRLQRTMPVRLAWDGACWHAGEPAANGQVEVMFDLGAWMLLRFRPDPPGAASRWLAVSAAGAGTALHGLRAAAYCRAPGNRPRVRSVERQPD